MIEKAGLKGLPHRWAESPRNTPDCPFELEKLRPGIFELISIIQGTILQEFGIELEPEIRILGEAETLRWTTVFSFSICMSSF